MREYKASKLRHVLLFLLFLAIGGAIARIIRYRLIGEEHPSLTITLIGTIVGYAVVFPLLMWLMTPFIERLNVTISADTISGPAKRGGKRIAIPLAKVDREKTGRQSFFEKLFGYRYIHSVDGETITLSGYAFNRATIKEILEQIEARTNEPQLPVP